MSWGETFRTALEALLGRRMRSLLTMLGILIGIAAVMLTVGLGEGARLQINKEINKLGSNLLIVMPGAATSSGVRMAGAALTLTMEDAALLSDATVAPDIAGVAPIMSTRTSVQQGIANWSTTITGTTTDWQQVRGRAMIDGRFFSAAEQATARRNALANACPELGLTAREAEVAVWLARGRTNPVTLGGPVNPTTGRGARERRLLQAACSAGCETDTRRRRTGAFAPRRFLPLRLRVFTRVTLTPQMASTASWISGLLADGWTLNVRTPAA